MEDNVVARFGDGDVDVRQQLLADAQGLGEAREHLTRHGDILPSRGQGQPHRGRPGCVGGGLSGRAHLGIPTVIVPLCTATLCIGLSAPRQTSDAYRWTRGASAPVLYKAARVILPAASPSIFTGIQIGLGLAWVLLVVGEMTGVPTGLGANIMDARQLSRTDLVISGMIYIGILGFLSDRVVMLIGRRALWWNPNART